MSDETWEVIKIIWVGLSCWFGGLCYGLIGWKEDK